MAMYGLPSQCGLPTADKLQDTGLISGLLAMPYFRLTFGHVTGLVQEDGYPYILTTASKSLFTSILSAGTFTGSLLGAPLADGPLGRKMGLQLGCLVFAIGVACQVASTTDSLFVIGRVLAGLGVGIVSVIVPLYQSECAPKKYRGTIVAGYQWSITIGLLVAAIVNNGFRHKMTPNSYRWPIALQFFWAAILAGGMLILPESPRWYVKRGQLECAANSLSRLLSRPVDSIEVQTELAEIKTNFDHENSVTGYQSFLQGYLACFNLREKRRQRTLVGIIIQAWQQLTGINFIFYFGTTFFLNSGIKNAFVISVITNCVNVAATPIGMYYVEHIGRRRLLLMGAASMAVCEFIIAIVGVSLPTSNSAGQRTLIAFVCVYIASFAMTWGPTAWIICGEIFPLSIRGKALSLCCASNWLWNFAIGYATPYLVDSGPHNANLGVKVFFIWGCTCFCGGAFVYFCVPETKGLSLEEVDRMYATTSVRNSTKYKPEVAGGEDQHGLDTKPGVEITHSETSLTPSARKESLTCVEETVTVKN